MNLLIRLGSRKVLYILVVFVSGIHLYAVWLRKVGVLRNYNTDGELNLPQMFVPKRTERREMLHSQRSNRFRTDNKSMSGEFRTQNESFMRFVPLGTELLKSQAAGHYSRGQEPTQFLQYKDGTIFKRMQDPPRGLRELNFYKTVFDPENTKKDIQALRKFVPCFMGQYHLEDHPEVIYIKLENIVSSFHKPCVMDIKIGKEIQEPEERRRHYKEVSTIRKTNGFSIAGMTVYSSAQDKGLHYNRLQLESLYGEELLSKGLPDFFNVTGQMRRDVIKMILKKTKAIEKWFLTQRTLLFYASSLLIVYDADDEEKNSILPCNPKSGQRPRYNMPSSTENMGQSDLPSDFGQLTTLEILKMRHENSHNVTSDLRFSDVSGNPKAKDYLTEEKNRICKYVKADVRMIDFTHAWQTEFRDDNYLFGLSIFIKYLEQLLE